MSVRKYHKAHRYLGIIVGIQLLLWTGSGLFFALNPIAKVRGETEQAEAPTLSTDADIASPGKALGELEELHGDIDVDSVLLRPHLGSSVYEITFRKHGVIRWALADVASGSLRAPVGRDEALALAQRDFAIPSDVAAVEYVTAVDADSEYRGRPLPAFRVTFDHPLGTRIYISSERGIVTARRNNRWRLFDFLWMLHILDFGARTDFNTVWLQLASALGLVTVLSGFILAGVTSPGLRRRFGRRRS